MGAFFRFRYSSATPPSLVSKAKAARFREPKRLPAIGTECPTTFSEKCPKLNNEQYVSFDQIWNLYTKDILGNEVSCSNSIALHPVTDPELLSLLTPGVPFPLQHEDTKIFKVEGEYDEYKDTYAVFKDRDFMNYVSSITAWPSVDVSELPFYVFSGIIGILVD